jgi:hypothetical protein
LPVYFPTAGIEELRGRSGKDLWKKLILEVALKDAEDLGEAGA